MDDIYKYGVNLFDDSRLSERPAIKKNLIVQDERE